LPGFGRINAFEADTFTADLDGVAVDDYDRTRDGGNRTAGFSHCPQRRQNAD